MNGRARDDASIATLHEIGPPGVEIAHRIVLRLEPWRLRALPGTVLFGAGGDVLDWHAD